MKKLLLVLCAAVLSIGVAPAPASGGGSLDVSGEVTCRDDGAYLIVWTAANPAIFPSAAIEAATLSGALEGSVTFTPNPIPGGESATGTTEAPGDTTGIVELDVNFGFGGTVAEIELAGDCEGAILVIDLCEDLGGCPSTTTTEPVRAGTVTPRLTG
jgi:hypothetical protein